MPGSTGSKAGKHVGPRLLDNTSVPLPREVMADTAADTYLIHGLFRLLGYQFSPRLADLPDRRYGA